MPYCRTCGAQIPADAVFCPNCGSATTVRDSRVQQLWIRRVVAYVIDWIIVTIATAILGFIAFLALKISLAAFGSSLFIPITAPAFGILGLSAVLFVLYFTIFEGTYQRTFGKSLMGLHVSTLDGKAITLDKAFIRNVSKVYWLFLLLDIIGGLFAKVEPGQRYLDKIADTIVISR